MEILARAACLRQIHIAIIRGRMIGSARWPNHMKASFHEYFPPPSRGSSSAQKGYICTMKMKCPFGTDWTSDIAALRDRTAGPVISTRYRGRCRANHGRIGKNLSRQDAYFHSSRSGRVLKRCRRKAARTDGAEAFHVAMSGARPRHGADGGTVTDRQSGLKSQGVWRPPGTEGCG